jgi:antitoxin (DNA-binding transcriptional repressor) of toxin-antitoxin stability system
MQASIRELKTNPSYYIRCAEEGHVVWITAHKRVIARLISAVRSTTSDSLGEVTNIAWNGKKPKGGRLRPTLKGKSLADTVLEMR